MNEIIKKVKAWYNIHIGVYMYGEHYKYKYQ